MREVAQRELRNNVAGVLREVEAGASVRITVRGKPVADLIPISARRPSFTPEQVAGILDRAPLDPAFLTDVEATLGETIDEL